MKTPILLSLLCVACATSPSDVELDQAAADQGADGKADDASGLTRLERATAAEVTASFKTVRGEELVACFAAYQREIDPAATQVTAAIADEFITVANRTNDAACANWFDLSQIVKGVLEAEGFAAATPRTIVGRIDDWAAPQLAEASAAGFVDVERADLLFYDDIMRVQEANARERERDPAGIDLAAIRDHWDEVRASSTLDRAYLNPVTFARGALDGSDIFKHLRAAFPLRGLSLEVSGRDAVGAFANAFEGPEGDPAFAPIAAALKKSSIRKRFYYARTGEVSSNVLIVVDEHGQAWGMQMGYSE